MPTNFKDDLRWLESLAFSTAQRIRPIILEMQRMEKTIAAHPNSAAIWNLYHWLLTPLSLWPFDIEPFARELMAHLKRPRGLTSNQKLILQALAAAPDPKRIEPLVTFEHLVQRGEYELLVKQEEKYAELEATLSKNIFLQETWAAIKNCFDVRLFQNSKGIIRRSMSAERNFRPSWRKKEPPLKTSFQRVFDAMCHRWQLYGMEYDKPLPLKVTVNPTPHGLLIMIPRLWSLDVRRDLNWALLQKLQHAYGASRQGPHLSRARLEIDSEAIAVVKHWETAGSQGLRGQKRCDFVLKQMNKHPDTDSSWVKRRLRRGRELTMIHMGK